MWRVSKMKWDKKKDTEMCKNIDDHTTRRQSEGDDRRHPGGS